MPKRLLLGCLLVALLLVPARSGLQAEAEPYVFQTDMYGSEQVPPVDTIIWGFFRFFFNEDRSQADVTLDVKGIDGGSITGADIHQGPPGTNGPIVLHLSDGNFIATGTHVSLTPAQLQAMAAGHYYASVKTKAHPEAAARRPRPASRAPAAPHARAAAPSPSPPPPRPYAAPGACAPRES